MAKYCSNCNKELKFGKAFTFKGKAVCIECGRAFKKQEERNLIIEKKKLKKQNQNINLI